jgi:hypothetical protein
MKFFDSLAAARRARVQFRYLKDNREVWVLQSKVFRQAGGLSYVGE